jgi:hypothetical protein
MEGRKMAAIRHLKVVRPANVKRAVALPVRKPNAAYRSREHLTEREVERLVEAAKDNRWGHRDATMMLLADTVSGPPSWLTSAGNRRT